MDSKQEMIIQKYQAKFSKLFFCVVATSAAVVGGDTAVQALTFNFSYEEGTSIDQIQAFKAAGDVWSSYLTDDVTVNLHVEITNLLPTNVLGGALPGITDNQNYGNFENAIYGDRSSTDDYTAYNYMPWDSYDARVNGQWLWNNTEIDLTRANSKALGLIDAHDTAIDGYILMSDLSDTSTEWHYDLDTPVAADKIDFYSVAVHEIGHALGFISGVDDTDVYYQSGSSGDDDDDDDDDAGYKTNSATSLDMFRQSSATTGHGNWDKIDLSVGTNSFFSINNNTNLANFSTGTDTTLGGDGKQASHWKEQTNVLGIMAPTIGLGERREVTELDLRAFDVIGWDRSGATQSSVDFSQLSMNIDDEVDDDLASELGSVQTWMIRGDSLTEEELETGGGDLDDEEREKYKAAKDFKEYVEEEEDININNVTELSNWVATDQNAKTHLKTWRKTDEAKETKASKLLNWGKLAQVIDMIINSGIYEWGFGGGYGDGCDSDEDNCGNSQELALYTAQILTQEGLYNEAYWSTLDVESEAVEVPEADSITTLLGFGLLGFAGLVKGKSKNKSISNK